MKLRFAAQPPAQVNVFGTTSPAGPMAIGLTEQGDLCRAGFVGAAGLSGLFQDWARQWPSSVFNRTKATPDKWRGAVLLIGSPFQRAVWQEISKIPLGRVATYGDIARALGKPKAARAVGAACGANPIPFWIPCHRVVASNGLGGFSADLSIKIMLLQAEGALSLS